MIDHSMQEPFIFHLLQDYRVEQGEVPVSVELIDFVKYLIDENLIPQKRIREYMLTQEFEALYRKGTHRSKSETVRRLSKKYKISESSIWLLLKQRNARFC